MNTAEQLAESIALDHKGVHVLLWDDQEDLVHALVILLAVLDGMPKQFRLLSPSEDSVQQLRSTFERTSVDESIHASDAGPLRPDRDFLLVLFLQQATSTFWGPWLNGWRSALADTPGTLLVIRNADFLGFQRHAPDLASFFESKVYDSSSMLSIWSHETETRISTRLPGELRGILNELPGPTPEKRELERWLKEHPAVRSDRSTAQ